MKTCNVPNCGRINVAFGLCQVHRNRQKKFGDVLADLPVSRSRFGSWNSRWKGGTVTDGQGRVVVYRPNHPYPSMWGTHVYRYRLVMEKHLGRYLLPSEIVHHINGNTTDDRIANLQVMTQAEHARLHMKERLKR